MNKFLTAASLMTAASAACDLLDPILSNIPSTPCEAHPDCLGVQCTGDFPLLDEVAVGFNVDLCSGDDITARFNVKIPGQSIDVTLSKSLTDDAGEISVPVPENIPGVSAEVVFKDIDLKTGSVSVFLKGNSLFKDVEEKIIDFKWEALVADACPAYGPVTVEITDLKEWDILTSYYDELVKALGVNATDVSVSDASDSDKVKLYFSSKAVASDFAKQSTDSTSKLSEGAFTGKTARAVLPSNDNVNGAGLFGPSCLIMGLVASVSLL